MKLSAKDLLELKIIDEIIVEPLGGAHRDKNKILENVRESIKNNLDNFKNMSPDEIVNQRKDKFLKIGRNKGFMSKTEELSSLRFKSVNLKKIFKLKKFKFLMIIFLFTIISSLFFIL